MMVNGDDDGDYCVGGGGDIGGATEIGAHVGKIALPSGRKAKAAGREGSAVEQRVGHEVADGKVDGLLNVVEEGRTEKFKSKEIHEVMNRLGSGVVDGVGGGVVSGLMNGVVGGMEEGKSVPEPLMHAARRRLLFRKSSTQKVLSVFLK